MIPRPDHKTKVVATIGPASDKPEVLERMLAAGMNVARVNFSHGDQGYHRELIGRIRAAARAAGRRVAIMGDLPGPKMRIGDLASEPVELQRDDPITLTTEDVPGLPDRVSVTFVGLPAAVRPGDLLYLNDGFILLRVTEVSGEDVHCMVRVGGELRSRKGLNLPGIDLGISAFTEEDAAWLRFASEHDLDAVSQSFVAGPGDIESVRRAAGEIGYRPFIIAKIERAAALENLDAILAATDGIMVARGDLGVEIPIEQIAVAQKTIMAKANRAGKPVITATQMLESMVKHRRPTRAEATDVANAILDGTDCVMLSAESAMGRFPVESIEMLAAIAAATEPKRPTWPLREALETYGRDGNLNAVDLIALSVHHTIERMCPRAVIVPTLSGATARNISRFRLPVWITALSPDESTCQTLQFSYGIEPVAVDEDRPDWSTFARAWLAEQGITDGQVLLTQGPSPQNPCGNQRMEILVLDPDRAQPCS
jgi:pyruvate kinase